MHDDERISICRKKECRRKGKIEDFVFFIRTSSGVHGDDLLIKGVLCLVIRRGSCLNRGGGFIIRGFSFLAALEIKKLFDLFCGAVGVHTAVRFLSFISKHTHSLAHTHIHIIHIIMAAPEATELKAQWKADADLPEYSMQDVAAHNTKSDTWIVIHGQGR